MQTNLIITIESKPRPLHLALAFAGGVIVGVVGVFAYRRLCRKDEPETAEDYDIPDRREPLACEINDAMMGRILRES